MNSLTPEAIIASCRSRPGLYIHVPFCSSLCPFCPYNKVLYQKDRAQRYFAALTRELEAYLAHIEGAFSSVYIGGGTPTLCLDELAACLERIPVQGERAIEVLPNHADQATVARLHALGITHVSLGLQSFDADMLRYLRRPNSVADNVRALENTVGHFACVDADLIFDVAFQDSAAFLHDVEICLRSGVDQLSTYPLMRFGYTPFGKATHHATKEHEVLRAAQALAESYGYERRSVWTFNRQAGPTYSSITREHYIGIGAGSATYTGRYFLLNTFSVERYIAEAGAGQLPLARMIRLGKLRAAAYALFWQAYTGSIDVERFEALYPAAPLLRWLLQASVRAGWLTIEGNTARLTPAGYDRYHDLERWVTYHFIEPLWAEMLGAAAEPGMVQGARSSWRRRLWLYLIGVRNAARR
ncbi:MAG: radical SAM protein [Anaerolineae bacterium]|jgi:oxygen-independent coproporphyrinogen-3 oxidase|nr:radical SAM protein [Anaerolineae bacterium]